MSEKMTIISDKIPDREHDVWVTTTEEFILNYAALPPEFLNWRYYRIEYYGQRPFALMEIGIYVPPWFDRDRFEELFERPEEWKEIPSR